MRSKALHTTDLQEVIPLSKAKEKGWHPTRFERGEDVNDGCSTKVALIHTDAGRAYLKALGNPMGPHALAREWIGTSIARWFGLRTFDFSLLTLERGIIVELGGGLVALPGNSFVTRAERGAPWSSDPKALDDLVNREDLTRLAILDTWLLNPDRFPPKGSTRGPNFDNVFLSVEGLAGKQSRLLAMDFSDCLSTGSSELSVRVADIKHRQNEDLYGMFPAFGDRFSRTAYDAALKRLSEVTKAEMAQIVNCLPPDWDVPGEVRNRIADFLVERARFLVDHLPVLLRPFLEAQDDLPSVE